MPNLRILEPLKAGLRNDFNPTAVGALYDAYGCESKGPGLVGYEYLPPVFSFSSSRAGGTLLFNVGENCYLYDPLGYFYTISSSWKAVNISVHNASSSAWTGNLIDDPSMTSSSAWRWDLRGGGWTLSSEGGVYLSTPSSRIHSIGRFITLSTDSPYLAEVTTEFGEDAKNGLRLVLSGESVNIYESGTHRFILSPSILSPDYGGGITKVEVFAYPGWVGNITKVSVIPPTSTTLMAGNIINSIAEHPNGFLCTGTKNTYYYDNEFGLFEVKGKGITTACSHTDGRMYLAGNLGELFSTNTGDPWARILFAGNLLKLDMGTAGLDSRCIYWSCIGMDDIFPLFFPYVDTDKAFLNRWERNECGFAFWPYNGDIYRLHSLGEGVMAYGAGGIAYLRPVGSPITVSMTAVGEYGLASATAFCGNSYVHYFIDYNDELWRVEAGPKLTKLGFKTYLSTLSTINMVLHPTENKVYISDSDTCYMLENDVLVEIPEIVHTMVMNKGRLGAIRTLLTDGFEVETGIFDFDSKDLKTVNRVVVDGFASSSGLYGKVFFRMNRASDWSDTGWHTLPLDQRVTGQEFKFGIRATHSNSAYLNYIDVEFDADPTRYSLGDWIS